MPKFETIKVGDLLWDYHSESAGNTTMRRWGNWPVEIISIDTEKRTAVVIWNGNREKTYSEYQLRRLRRTTGKER